MTVWRTRLLLHLENQSLNMNIYEIDWDNFSTLYCLMILK